jgi:hypothetical protein
VYPGAVVTALRLQEEQLQRLVAHVAATFKRQRDADLEASDQVTNAISSGVLVHDLQCSLIALDFEFILYRTDFALL